MSFYAGGLTVFALWRSSGIGIALVVVTAAHGDGVDRLPPRDAVRRRGSGAVCTCCVDAEPTRAIASAHGS